MPSYTATSRVPGSADSVPVVMRRQVKGHKQTHLREFVHPLGLLLVLKWSLPLELLREQSGGRSFLSILD